MGSCRALVPLLFPTVPSPSLRMVFKTALLIMIFLLPGNGNRSHEDYTMFSFDRFSTHYGHFPESLRLEMLSESRKMFEFGFNCYMKCAFPQDELVPIHCLGRGPDVANPDNININDVLGDYSLTSSTRPRSPWRSRTTGSARTSTRPSPTT